MSEENFCFTYKSGTEVWINGEQLHRVTGPAVIRPNGTTRWWVSGVEYDDPKLYQKAAGISDFDMAIILLKYPFNNKVI